MQCNLPNLEKARFYWGSSWTWYKALQTTLSIVTVC